jgi:GntR family transcriptional regulator / MocR family aminotransferase
VPSSLLDGVTQVKLRADRGSPAFEQLAFAEFLNRGEFERHLRRTRYIYRQRRDVLVSALREHCPGMGLQGVAAGLHLLLPLPARSDEEAIVAEAQRQSIRVYGARHYYAARDQPPAPALLVGYGGLPAPRIPLAVKRLAAVLERTPAAATF